MDPGRRYEEEGLLARTRSFSGSSAERTSEDFELAAFKDTHGRNSPSSIQTKWWSKRPRRPAHGSKTIKPSHRPHHRPWRRRCLCFRPLHLLLHAPYCILALILVCAIFFPSYSNPPQRYPNLRKRVLSSESGGAANPNNEKIFIAASLYDKEGELLSGDWGRSVRRLVGILGHDNVFVSVYENDPDEKSKAAIEDFRKWLPCDSAIVDERLDLAELPHIAMPDGSQRLKRIAFLAEVRNRALRPLEDVHSKAHSIRWDKLLYLNDIAFDPIDVANLLFNTNADEATGKTKYRAACAVDFINPFKFYDTFATRDLDGYDMGVPFYPWFTNAGTRTSRRDVLAQTDAVRVKSCWGGMVAFEAKWFQPHLYEVLGDDLVVPWKEPQLANDLPSSEDLAAAAQTNNSASIPPLRFRSETDTYWDASECCLINADLAHLPLSGTSRRATGSSNDETGIYMNPFVRVAYSRAVLNWLPFTKRFERLYPLIHNLVNSIGHRPGYNPRQLEQPGDEVVDRVWQWDEESLEKIRNGSTEDLAEGLHGSFQEVKRKAQPGQFCGGRKLLVLKDHPGDSESPWGRAKIPPLG